MKFVIKSLLFVNLILQMTSSLRKCFDHDQNIMLTIIVLAFSVIGLIGLVIGNRFILIIFSASTMLILIASITIYAIGTTEQDSMRPKVPYFTTLSLVDHEPGSQSRRQGQDSKLKSLVGRWLNKNQDQRGQERNRKSNSSNNKTLRGSSPSQRPRVDGSRSSKSTSKKSPPNEQILPSTVSPALLDDYSDDAGSIQHLQVPLGELHSNARAYLATTKGPLDSKRTSVGGQQQESELKSRKLLEQRLDDPAEPDPGAFAQVESEQWVAYERYLYERYLDMVSQSIDLFLHSILAAWMALLLDEDSDQCFGSKSSSPGAKRSRRASQGGKEAPVYNYNGVRYSIRPDVGESPTRVVVR